MRLFTSSRRFYQLEPLERRYFLTIVPIDATAAVPFEGLVATNLRLPAHATGLALVNVMINGQWDYAPTAVSHADGTFDLYARMTFQRGGTEQMSVWFRNDRTGGWDVLEQGEQTVKPNLFNASVTDVHLYDQIPGTRVRKPLATFTTTALTLPLDQYVAEVNWFGEVRPGRLVRADDGSVAVYLDNTYLPISGDEDVSVTIRAAGAAPDAAPVGYSLAWVSVGSYGVGIGTFLATMTSDDTVRVELPNQPKQEGNRFHYFIPATESDGWESTFTATLIWQYHGGNEQATTPGTVVRNADGTYSVLGQLPPDRGFEYPMMKIRETVHRPAVDGMPAQTYTIEYVGSFDIVAEIPGGAPPPVDLPTENGNVDSPTSPGPGIPVHGDVKRPIDEARFSALASNMSALDSGGFGPVHASVLSNADDDSLVGDDEDETDDMPPPA